MRSEPYHDELHTFRGDIEQRRHRKLPLKPVIFLFGNSVLYIKKCEQQYMHFPGNVKYLWVLLMSNYYVLMLCYVKATAFAVCLAPKSNANDNNNNGRNGSFLRGWLPHRGKA